MLIDLLSVRPTLPFVYYSRKSPIEYPIEDAVDSQNNQREPPEGSSDISPILPKHVAVVVSTPYGARYTSDDLANNTASTSQTHWLEDTDSSLDETDIDFLEDANREKDVYRYCKAEVY